jgi:nucleotide-binding universal stress UspA family protein
MNTIIVPTDFSDNAANALEYALIIARKTSARIYLLHSFHLPPSNTTTVKKIDHILKQDAEDAMATLLAQVRSNPANQPVDIHTIIKKGSLLGHVTEAVNSHQADLIVMGTQGASGLEEIFIGSNAADVIANATCPVLTIPREAKTYQIRNILYATDLSNDLPFVTRLVALARLFDAHIHIAHVVTNPNEANDQHQLAKLADAARQQTGYPELSTHTLQNRSLEDGLEQIIHQTNTDMLCMVTRKRNLFGRIFDRSVTKQMVYHTHVPLLAFHTE